LDNGVLRWCVSTDAQPNQTHGRPKAWRRARAKQRNADNFATFRGFDSASCRTSVRPVTLSAFFPLSPQPCSRTTDCGSLAREVVTQSGVRYGTLLYGKMLDDQGKLPLVTAATAMIDPGAVERDNYCYKAARSQQAERHFFIRLGTGLGCAWLDNWFCLFIESPPSVMSFGRVVQPRRQSARRGRSQRYGSGCVIAKNEPTGTNCAELETRQSHQPVPAFNRLFGGDWIFRGHVCGGGALCCCVGNCTNAVDPFVTVVFAAVPVIPFASSR